MKDCSHAKHVMSRGAPSSLKHAILIFAKILPPFKPGSTSLSFLSTNFSSVPLPFHSNRISNSFLALIHKQQDMVATTSPSHHEFAMKLLTTTLLTLLTILFTGTASALPTDIEYTPLAERQVGCSQMLPCAQLEGDGDPHQVVLHKRLSLVALCDASAPCALSDSEPVQRSYIIQADTHGTQWTSGGFAVVESVQTGTHPCVGGPGQRVCAFAAIWHTEVSV